MEPSVHWFFCSLMLAAGTLTSLASDYPDYSIFWEGESEEKFKKCVTTPFECQHLPDCDHSQDDLTACAKRIYGSLSLCELEEVKILIADYYQGYNEVRSVFCKNETIQEELKRFIDNSCWNPVVVCLAPLEMLHQNSENQDQKYCKNLRTFLNDKCLDPKFESCHKQYVQFREKYFGNIQCQGENSASKTTLFGMSIFLLIALIAINLL